MGGDIDTEKLFRNEHKRVAEQMSINFNFLMDAINIIHFHLCPGKMGTWQQRTEQAVEAAKEISRKKRKRKK